MLGQDSILSCIRQYCNDAFAHYEAFPSITMCNKEADTNATSLKLTYVISGCGMKSALPLKASCTKNRSS